MVYFNDHEPELDLPGTVFVKSEPFPRIKTMAGLAYQEHDFVAIINADIVVNENLNRVSDSFKRYSIPGGTSRRFDLETGELWDHDKGRDIFLLCPRAWREVWRNIDPKFRIGHNTWDSWMISFMRRRYPMRFFEFTWCRCIFHPRHEERERPHGNEIEDGKPFIGYWNGRPDPQLRL